MFGQEIDWLYCIVFFAIAFVVTYACCPIIKKIAFKIGAIDEPSKRRVHKVPTARLGGVSIFLGILAACIFAYIIYKIFKITIPVSYYNVQHINYYVAGAGAIFIFIVGIIDDVKYLPSKIKLFLQIIAATITSCSGLLIERFFNPFANVFVEFGWLSYPITIVYLVAFANIINLIDGLDGLASGTTLIVATTMFVFSLNQNRADAAILSLGIMGACFAFLFFNFYPAKIFMGDSGSLTLGFLLGIASLLSTARTAAIISMLVPVFAAGVPIIDTLFAIIRRKRSHIPIDQADTGHIHHRLLKSGLTHKTTVYIMWIWTILLSIGGIAITFSKNLFVDIAVLIIALSFTFFMIRKLHLLEPVLKHHYNHRKIKNRKNRKTLYGIYNQKEDTEDKENDKS